MSYSRYFLGWKSLPFVRLLLQDAVGTLRLLGYDVSRFMEPRLWNDPHLISYMESHDEERIMYKNITYGNTNGSQNAKNPIKALERTEGLAVLMLTTPGPKMIWQFGEMGYDISIDYPCRICLWLLCLNKKFYILLLNQ